MWHLPATCEIILPIVSCTISVPNPIFQVPPVSTSQSLIVHAVMNGTRQADSTKSASILEASLREKFRTQATASIDFCIVVGARYHVLPGVSVMLFVLLVRNFSSNGFYQHLLFHTPNST